MYSQSYMDLPVNIIIDLTHNDCPDIWQLATRDLGWEYHPSSAIQIVDFVKIYNVTHVDTAKMPPWARVAPT